MERKSRNGSLVKINQPNRGPVAVCWFRRAHPPAFGLTFSPFRGRILFRHPLRANRSNRFGGSREPSAHSGRSSQRGLAWRNCLVLTNFVQNVRAHLTVCATGGTMALSACQLRV